MDSTHRRRSANSPTTKPVLDFLEREKVAPLAELGTTPGKIPAHKVRR